LEKRLWRVGGLLQLVASRICFVIGDQKQQQQQQQQRGDFVLIWTIDN
jgi:hypothetical protein